MPGRRTLKRVGGGELQGAHCCQYSLTLFSESDPGVPPIRCGFVTLEQGCRGGCIRVHACWQAQPGQMMYWPSHSSSPDDVIPARPARLHSVVVYPPALLTLQGLHHHWPGVQAAQHHYSIAASHQPAAGGCSCGGGQCPAKPVAAARAPAVGGGLTVPASSAARLRRGGYVWRKRQHSCAYCACCA